MLQKIKNSLKFLLPAILISFILFNIYQNSDLVLTQWSNFEILPLVISFLIMILIYLEAALNYHVLIKAINYPLKFKQSLYIFIVSNASRYIPGSIWQYIGRVEIAKKIAQIPRSISVLALVLEVFLLVNAAIIVSLFALPFFNNIPGQSYLLIFLLPISLIFLHPKISSKLILLIAKVGKKDITKSISQINLEKLITTLPWFILNFLLNGIALFFLTKAIYPDIGIENIILFSGAFAFSWVVGYLSLFAPAGLGVTDVLLIYILSLQMPFPLASTIALSYRVFLTIAELVVFVLVMRIKTNEKSTKDTKSAWEERSKKFGYKVEGVATKSLPLVINNQLDQWMLENIDKTLNNKKNFKVLDLGCGYGRLSKPLLSKYKNLKTYGIDISKNYVDLYNKDLNPRGKALEGDIKKLPYKNNYFDTVFIVTTLMYLTKINDQQKAISEIIRVLKPGGKAVIIERSPSGYFIFTAGGLVNLIRGKKNQEITAVSIEKNQLIKLIKSKGELDDVSGIPLLSLYMPFSIILSKLNGNLVSLLLSPINSLDLKLKHFLWPSLYLSYTISKPASKK